MKNIVSLEGKTIIVTGGAQGIGRALVELSVELGAKVVAVDKNAEGLASLDKSRGDIMTLQGDIAEPAFAAEAATRCPRQSPTSVSSRSRPSACSTPAGFVGMASPILN